jgi:hypothetical protein
LPLHDREQWLIPDFPVVREVLEETELERVERRLKLQNLLAALNFLHRAVAIQIKTPPTR